MHPRSLFSLAEHLERLSKDGDPLEVLAGTITIRSGHTRNWAGRPLPRSPANVSGGMPPDTLPTHQTTIMKERDSTPDW